jgi:hypothetical protein
MLVGIRPAQVHVDEEDDSRGSEFYKVTEERRGTVEYSTNIVQYQQTV